MTINLYDTMAKKLRPFEPIDSSNVRMYVCGPTVYDYAHVGNARPMVVFDTLFRLFRHTFGDKAVNYTRNITDVDDKIIDIARKNDEPIDLVTERTIQAFHDDLTALGTLPVTHEPRCTEFITQMVEMIEVLIEKGHAYAAEGHVLFAVKSDPNYGRLSNRSIDDMIAGARVEVAPYKKDPMDFVLWKPSNESQPGWESLWGKGRPGWHIECSAMAKAYLGDKFDLHAGGLDLVFPHHENEVAQSCCANDTDQMANYWLHNGYVTVNGEKMSKSLGNFFTPHQLLEDGHSGEAIRLTLLSAHYRAPLDFNDTKLVEAKTQLDRMYRVVAEAAGEGAVDPRFIEALSDDINTPQALAVLHELAGEGRGADLKASADLLGLLQLNPDVWFKGPASDDDAEIDNLIAARDQARADKNWAEADRVRDLLTEMGIVMEDAAGKTGWRRV